MKTPYNDLLDLISSLTKNEKIYFKKFAGTSGSNENKIYLKLFDEIESQTTHGSYDERKIKDKFKNENFIKQLHVAKIYLYNLILKSLYLQNTNYNELSKLREMINRMEVLNRKGLYLQCGKIISKAKKIAQKEDYLIELLRINYFEIKVQRELFHSMHGKKTENNLPDLHSEKLEIVKLIDNESIYEKYENEIYNMLFKGKLPGKKENQLLRKFLNSKHLANVSKALTYNSKSSYYFAKANLYNLLGKKEKDHECQKQHIEYLEGNFKSSGIFRYVKLINNYVISSLNNNKFDDYDKYLEKLQKIPVGKINNKQLREKMEALIFRIYYSHKVNFSLLSGEYEDSYNKLSETLEGLNKYKKYIQNSYQLALYLSISIINFYAGNFNEALKWINHVINEKDYESKEDFYCFALMFSNVIHFELKNFELLEYNTKSTLNYLIKKNRVFLFEKKLLEFLRKYSIGNDKNERKLYLETIRRDIKSIMKEREEKIFVEYFDYLSWIESKIKGVQIRDIVVEKFRNKIKAR